MSVWNIVDIGFMGLFLLGFGLKLIKIITDFEPYRDSGIACEGNKWMLYSLKERSGDTSIDTSKLKTFSKFKNEFYLQPQDTDAFSSESVYLPFFVDFFPFTNYFEGNNITTSRKFIENISETSILKNCNCPSDTSNLRDVQIIYILSFVFYINLK